MILVSDCIRLQALPNEQPLISCQSQHGANWRESKPRNANNTSLLTTLPAELREMILELLLGTSKELCTDHWSTKSEDEKTTYRSTYRGPPRMPETNIMATCQQMHAESAQILYSKNVFVYHNRLQTTFEDEMITEMHRRYTPLVKRAVATIAYTNLVVTIKRL